MRYDVFISYARKDGTEQAEKLARDLADAGLHAWLDRRQLDPDQDFTAELERAIEDSTRVLCCVTPDTRRYDSFVRREIGYALAVQKPIVPLIFESTIPPILIVNVTREDFTRVPWQLAFSRLLVRLRREESQDDQYVTVPVDPFQAYLNVLYQQIVHVLKNTVFSEILLSSTETSGAVTKPVRTALPVAFWRGAGEILATDEAGSQSFRDFGTAYATYNGRVLLLGDPGAGKTTTVLAFARDRVAARLDDSAEPLPLLAPISTWDAVREAPFAEWLHEQVTMLDRDTIATHLGEGRALLILDGLDELGIEGIDKGERFDPRRRFASMIPSDGPVVITCRVKDYADTGLRVALSGAVTLKGLDDTQIHEYLTDVPELWLALEGDRDLRDVVRTPLLLAILRRACLESATERNALRDLKRLEGGLRERIFDVYVRSRFAHEQQRGYSELRFSLDDTYRLLGRAVVDGVEYYNAGHRDRGVSIEESIAKQLAEQGLSFVEQMLRLNILLRSDQRGLTFIHALLRDYFGFRYALAFLRSAEFHRTGPYDHRKRALQLLAESDDTRALEPLLAQVGSYVDFPLAYSLRFADPRVLLAHARSLSQDTGDPRYDYVSDAAAGSIRVVATRLGSTRSANALASAIASAAPKERADYVFALGFLRLEEGRAAIAAALADDDATVRGCALFALAAVGAVEAVGATARRLLYDESEIRSWTYASWRGGTRVRHLARAALEGVIADPISSNFPSELFRRITTTDANVDAGHTSDECL